MGGGKLSISSNEFRYLLEEVRVIYKNFNKDNDSRRKDIHVTQRKLNKIVALEVELDELRVIFNKEIKEYAETI